jgi:multidrug efflux pump subunit AcrA (membrane-fusion protein)
MLLLGTVALFLVGGLALPWRQNVPGKGKVIAFAPKHREQPVESPISGRVVNWHVQEGQQVEKGELIVQLSDNDPRRLERLASRRAARQARLTGLESRVQRLRSRVESLRRSRKAELESARSEVAIAEQKVTSAEQALQAAEAKAETTEINLTRTRALHDEGLTSQRNFELAQLADRKARASVQSAEASLQSARMDQRRARALLRRTKASTQADIESAQAKLHKAETDQEDARAALAKVETKLERQQAQRVVAPQQGIISNIAARQGTEQVSQGQVLAQFVPSSNDRAVALTVNGNDAALIRKGDEVRLQFEGWPALQFAGWPSAAVGTFGGRVAFVDPAGNGQGNFRVVVKPAPNEPPWPERQYLRPGSGARGWFLLREVTVGYEMWRQFNDFPPRTRPSRQDGASAQASGASGTKAGGKGGL